MGTIIFDHLVLFRHSGPKKGELPYSSLIFQILCSQGLNPAGLYLTNAPKTFSIHHSIFTPTRVKDLPYQGPDPAHAAPSFNTDEDELVTVPRSFLLQMLRFVGQCKESSTFMIPKIQSLLSTKKGEIKHRRIQPQPKLQAQAKQKEALRLLEILRLLRMILKLLVQQLLEMMPLHHFS